MLGTNQSAVIVGASRGLGRGLVEEYLRRGWRVVGTMRGTGHAALHELAGRANGALDIERVDITKEDDIAALGRRLAGRRFDLLFVNAGVANGPRDTVAGVSTAEFIRIMVTNALGPMRVIEALQGLVKPTGTIAVMSSALGSVAGNESGGWEVYRASKAALNMLMRSYAARHAGDRRAHLIICPGWVRTDMGGTAAPLAIDDSIPAVVDAIASRTGKPGLLYLDRHGAIVPW